MRNLPFLALVLTLLPAVDAAAQAETRLPNVSEIIFHDNASVNRALTKPVRHYTTLKVDGKVDETHLQKLFTHFASADSVFIDGLALVQLPASTEKMQARHLSIARCEKLDLSSACTFAGRMPKLKSVVFTVPVLNELPASVRNLRHLEKVSFINTDLSLADGYALNYNLPGALYSESRATLGFRAPELGAFPLELVYGSYNSEVSALHLAQLSDYFQGVPGAVTKLASRNGKNLFRYVHPLIRRPISGTDVARNYYTFNAEKGASFSYPSGTDIRIPANAFVDKNGRPVSGEVTISYREFRDAADIIVSGIPMKYDSAGQTADFESAGMFELVASAAGNEVDVAPGKNIAMQFAVTQPESSYNFYRLDEEKGWEFEGKPGEVNNPAIASYNSGRGSDSVRENFSLAVNNYLRLLRNSKALKNIDVDTANFDQRFYSNEYMSKAKLKTRDLSERKIKKYRRIRLRRVQLKGENTAFTFSRIYEDSFDELKSYRNVVWQLNEKLSSKEFKARFGKGYNDVRVINENGNYFIELKNFWKVERVSVKPVKIDREGKFKEVKSRDMKHRDKHYNNILAIQRKEFNKRNESKIKLNKLRLAAIVDSTGAWQQSQRLMNENETRMSFTEWQDYISNTANIQNLGRNNSGNREQMLETQSVLTRSLKLKGTGVYNCDQIARLKNPMQIFALAKTAAGKIFPAVMAYVISKGKNMALIFGGMGDGGVSLNFSQSDSCKVVMIDGNGNVAVIPAASLHAQKNYMHDAVYSFHAATFTESPPTLPEMRKLISWR
ncbi:MAG: hypothetical protein MUC87_09820 [Bacteroidia bacterium]|nr:hypothetical protein [Bacteroidia bacterium]